MEKKCVNFDGQTIILSEEQLMALTTNSGYSIITITNGQNQLDSGSSFHYKEIQDAGVHHVQQIMQERTNQVITAQTACQPIVLTSIPIEIPCSEGAIVETNGESIVEGAPLTFNLYDESNRKKNEELEKKSSNTEIDRVKSPKRRRVQINLVSNGCDAHVNLKNSKLAKIDYGEVRCCLTEVCNQIFIINSELTGVVEMSKTERNVKRCVSNEIQIKDSQQEQTNITGGITDGFMCEHCSYVSRDPIMCERCRRPNPETVSQLNSEELEEYCTGDSSSTDSSPTKDNRTKRRKCTRKSKRESSPILEDTVVLSSDDEDANSSRLQQNGESAVQHPLTDVFSKEPVITADPEINMEPMSLRGGGMEIESLLDSTDIEKIRLDCRTVRFGSYKVVPQDKIILTEHGLKLKVPTLSKSNSATVIKILMKDIVKVLIHFGQSGQLSSASAPAMFYYITHEASKRIRDSLCMTNKNKDLYFDPTSKEELHKRITLLPENVSQTDRLFIKSIYEARCLMEELTWDEANDILVRAAPKDVQHNLKKESSNLKHMPTTTNTPNDIQVIMVYPPQPIKGGISINTEDYACLNEDQFLNDVIIDFYLKYLWLNVLSEEDRKRTHIFSSFFYKRLTMMSPRQSSSQDKLTPAEKRHARVKGWTKSVDIFDKDFIIIPINEKSHWFLGIICFPGLTGPVRMSDGTPVPNIIRKRDTSVLAGGQIPAKIWGTTISIVKPEERFTPKATINLLEVEEEKDESDRDEAEADDDDMEPNTSDEESGNEELMDEATPRVSKVKPNLEPIKQPCILIFDSLACSSRSRVCATLREYLQVEWKVRHKGKIRDFSKDIFKGAVPKVPQQTNFTDCGLYVLQYVEAFFKNPISDYRMPIRSIKDWFLTDVVNRKRYEIMQLLLTLMKEQDVDIARLNLPQLEFSFSSYDGEDDEMMGDDGDYDEEVDGLEEEEDEHMAEEEDDELEDEYLYKSNKPFDHQHHRDQRLELARLEMGGHSSNRIATAARLERLEPSPRQSPRRFDSPSPRLDKRASDSIRAEIRSEAMRVEQQLQQQQQSRPRLADSVTVCEPNSKRKLPFNLQELRNPRLASPQTSIEKVKKMRVD